MSWFVLGVSSTVVLVVLAVVFGVRWLLDEYNNYGL